MPTIFIPSPHFPPSALPPSQRVRLLVRHLYEFGWRPVIFTVDHRYREELADPWMIEIAGNEFEKIQVGCLDQRTTRKVGIGDLGLRMFIPLFFSLIKHARRKKPALILYPVPPWYIMVMAPLVKWITGVPYVIDFIDPWVNKSPGKNRKARMSQWLARRLEGFAVKHSDGMLAVSKGILDDLQQRYPNIGNKPTAAAPYGVEVSDFGAIRIERQNSSKMVFRYIGAISEAMLPVVDTLLKALKLVNSRTPLQVIFTGTSYAGPGRVKPVLDELIGANDVSSFVTENPSRVGYKEAIMLNLDADMLLVIGDTTPYYAASKLMGLAASGRPFFAFVHGDSFPASFLGEANFSNKTCFTTPELGTAEKVQQLAGDILRSIEERDRFVRIDINNPVLAQHTARAMTNTFSNIFKQVVHE